MKKIAAIVFCLLLATSAFAQQQFITIATGGTAGTYFPLGGALADIWNKNIPKMNATAQSTGASIANINLLKGGNVDVIFTQNDVANYSYNGTELLKDQAYKDLRGIVCLYNETIQLVALESSGIKTVADLKGKKVSVGAAGSGTEANARQILEAAGLTYNDIKVQYLSFGESANNMKDGNIDAAFNTAGIPTAAIQDLSVSKKMVLVPIDGAIAAKLMAKYPFYALQIVPTETSKGQTKEVTTVASNRCSRSATSCPPTSSISFLRLCSITPTGYRRTCPGQNVKLETALEGMSFLCIQVPRNSTRTRAS